MASDQSTATATDNNIIRDGAIPFENFNWQAYLDANPDVAANEGFSASPETVYSHYTGVYTDDPTKSLPDWSGFRSGEYGYTENQAANQDNITELNKYLDPETGTLREELLGGDITNEYDLEGVKNGDPQALADFVALLQERTVGRSTGFLGDFGNADAFEQFKTSVGVQSPYSDAYGQVTPVGKLTELADNPYLAEGTQLALQQYEPKENEFMDSGAYELTPTTHNVTAAQAAVTTAQNAEKTSAQSFIADQAYEAIAKEQIVAARQEGLTDYVEPQKGEVDVNSTVQGQLANLMQQFEGGKVPSFAAGAIRAAEQRLAGRGMGASSMAGAAIVHAAMEASTPIAAADAETFRRMSELNLNNRQQAEVLNAQMILQVDMANLSNEQQANVMNTSNRVKAVFTDTAATNSAKQFNAQSEQQNDQFFASMFNQTSQFNAAQTNAIAQSNAGQANAVAKFNAELTNQREQFNSKNRLLIDQANVVYRRQVNTANTAIANAENEFNVRNLFNISQNAQAQLLQEARDAQSFARTKSLNEDQYLYKLALTSFTLDKQLDIDSSSALGGIAGSLLAGVVQGIFATKTATKTP